MIGFLTNSPLYQYFVHVVCVEKGIHKKVNSFKFLSFKNYLHPHPQHLLLNDATPGNSLPSKYSKEAPPPVEM